MSVNKAILLGNVGKNPEVRETSNGTKVVNFPLATQRYSKKERVTDWHNITAYGKTADICEQYVDKGKQIYLEGNIRNESWTGKDGNKKFRTVIVAQMIELLGKRSESKTEEPKKENSSNYSEDDIPF